jgi:hypothetical protein
MDSLTGSSAAETGRLAAQTGKAESEHTNERRKTAA